MQTQPAVLGMARLGNVRLGYESAALRARRRAAVRIVLNGVEERRRGRVGSLTIHDILNDAPNTASLRIGGTPAPEVSQTLRVSVNSDAPRLLFNGTLQAIDQTYEGKAHASVWSCTAIDDTAQLNRRKPFGTWTNVSATTVITEAMAASAPSFTTTHVQAGLPPISIIADGSEDMSGFLARIDTMIGGYHYVEDSDLHQFQVEATDTPDALDTTPGRLADDPAITVRVDVSQVRTRVFGKGHGEALLCDVAAGETILPIADVIMFADTLGQAIAGTTPDGAQSQVLTYTNRQLGIGGSLVGPGAAPSTAATAAIAVGTGLGAGVYKYAYTDVTASGETLPSPLVTVTTMAPGTVADPVSAPSGVQQVDSPAHYDSGTAPNLNATAAPPSIGDVVEYAISWSTSAANDLTKETHLGPASTPLTVTAALGQPSGWTVAKSVDFYPFIGTVPFGATYLHVWRRRNAGTWQILKARGGVLLAIPAALAGGYHLQDSDYPDSGVTAPSANAVIAAYQQVSVAGIALGPSGTTGRKVYRTAVNGSQLKLHTTIANNTAVSIATDTTADGSLGANAPTSDTSALGQVAGQVIAGSTSLLTASAAPFSSTGGWARLGSQVIRYTGVTDNTLTGIPVSGIGALMATVSYGAPVTPAPSITLKARAFIPIAWHSGVSQISTLEPHGLVVGDVVSMSGVTVAGVAYTMANPVLVTVTIVDDAWTFWGSAGAGAVDITGASDPVIVSTTAPVAVLAMQKGTAVHVWVQRDDRAAQAALIARAGGDGIYEHWISDERRGIESLTQRCDADLRLFSSPLVTVTYATRDQKTKSGKTITVNLTTPLMQAELTIQDVTISELETAAVGPLFTVTASSVRISLDDLLRRLAAAVGV